LVSTIFKLHPNSLFEDATGPGLEPVGGEFQPSSATAYSGGGAHFLTLLHSIFVLNGHSPWEPPRSI
jgi:hypothetical protein